MGLSLLTTLVLQCAKDYLPPSPLRMQLSSIFGSISFACYLVLMVPQMVEQWRLKTVEGVSLSFLGTWMLGDLANFIGSIWAGLLPEVILIAAWFLLSDLLTIVFYFYIKAIYDDKRKKMKAHHIAHDEELLLGNNNTNYQSTQRRDNNDRRKSHSSTLEDIIYEPGNHSVFVKYVVPIGFVVLSGLVGSLISPNSQSIEITKSDTHTELGPQIFGYISAALYLIARLPQIYQNYRLKSTEGLSLLFFLLTMLGNITYSLQIVTFRSDMEYIKLNLSWILGSAGTIIQDVVIVYQFWIYKDNHNLEIDL